MKHPVRPTHYKVEDLAHTNGSAVVSYSYCGFRVFEPTLS